MNIDKTKIRQAEIEEIIQSIFQKNLDREFLLTIGPKKWQQIDRELSQNPLCLLLFFILKNKNCFDVLPATIRERWQGFYYHTLKKNILGQEQLAEIQNALAEAKIEFILLKGLAIAATAYNDLGARSSVDIDLLVRKDDLLPLKYQLEKLNYRLQNPKQAALLERFGCGDWLFFKKGSLPLDIHWQLCQYERLKGIIHFNEPQIFQDAAPINIKGRRFLSLSPEDLFLYLCMHFALVHRFSGLPWLYDLMAISGHYAKDFDWQLLAEKAKKAHLATTLYYVLYFGKKWLAMDFPVDIMGRLQPSFIKRKLLGSFIARRNVLALNHSSGEGKGYYIGQGWLVDGLFNIMRVFAKMLFPSREWLCYHYGRGQQKSGLKFSYRLRHVLGLFFNLAQNEG